MFQKTTAPFTRELLSDNRKGCPYGMIFNSILIATESSYIFVNFLGGSKPLPYIVGYNFHSVKAPTSFHYSLFTFHSSLPIRACHRPNAADYKIGKSTEKRPLLFTLTNNIAYVTMILLNERKKVMQKFNRATTHNSAYSVCLANGIILLHSISV